MHDAGSSVGMMVVVYGHREKYTYICLNVSFTESPPFNRRTLESLEKSASYFMWPKGVMASPYDYCSLGSLARKIIGSELSIAHGSAFDRIMMEK